MWRISLGASYLVLDLHALLWSQGLSLWVVWAAPLLAGGRRIAQGAASPLLACFWQLAAAVSLSSVCILVAKNIGQKG